MSRRRKGETNSRNTTDDSTNKVTPISINSVSWNDVFHHSLVENVEVTTVGVVSPKLSCVHESIKEVDDSEEEEMEISEQRKDSSDQETKEHHQYDDVKGELLAENHDIDIHSFNCDDGESYAHKVAAMMKEMSGCLIDEKKCDDEENQSLTSEDLEYMYGTLPMDQLPETPRRSNVSPESKKSPDLRLLSTPQLYSTDTIVKDTLLGPETLPEEDEDTNDLYWV
jgi:hypothetical protein